MTFLILESISNKPHLETSAEIALTLARKKEKVSFSWLGDNLPWNEWELSLLPKILGCSEKKKIQKFLNILQTNKINIVKYDINFDINKKIIKWANKFNGNINQLKKFRYKKCNLGIGVASSLISHYHDSTYKTENNLNVARKALMSAALIYERANFLVNLIKPSCIITFNGRFATSLPIIEIAKKKKIKLLRHERGSSLTKYEIFNHDIHDPYERFLSIKRFTKNKKKNFLNTGHKFYINKRNHIPLEYDMEKKHFLFQEKEIFPKNISKCRRIVFFTASEDEHESIKYQLSKLAWDSQLKALNDLIDVIKDDNNIELIIRVHPIPESRKSYKDQNKWKMYENNKIKVIDAFDKTDSYSLMDSADVVISYGGNIAIEAAYWGKFSITLRKAIYSYMNIVYEPKNKKELSELLNKNFKFKIAKKEQCLPYGCYFVKFGIKYKYYKPFSYFDGYFFNKQITSDSLLLMFLKKIKIDKLYKYIRFKIFQLNFYRY
jgi:hypothetical protein